VLNRPAILDHWHGRTDGAELARALRPAVADLALFLLLRAATAADRAET
jgi:hypothetical protein